MRSQRRAAVGIGLRTPHLAQIACERPSASLLEIHAENYVSDPAALQAVERLCTDYAFSLHAVGLSLGSAEGVDEAHLDRVARLVERLQPACVSDHLSWSITGGRYFNDLLPLPYTEEALAVVVRNVDRVQSKLGRQISVENPSCYLAFSDSSLSEPEFLTELACRSGCGLLLDVNNVYVSGHNLRRDPRRWLDLPVASITQYHLAGHAVNDADGESILIDDHGSRVAPAVWTLFDEAIRRFGPRPTVIEWDSDIPALSVLLGEAERARQVTEFGADHAAVAA